MASDKSISQEFDDIRFSESEVGKYARLAIGLSQAMESDKQTMAAEVSVNDEHLKTFLGSPEELRAQTGAQIDAVRRYDPVARIENKILTDTELKEARREQFASIDMILNAQFGEPKYHEL